MFHIPTLPSFIASFPRPFLTVVIAISSYYTILISFQIYEKLPLLPEMFFAISYSYCSIFHNRFPYPPLTLAI